MFTYVLHIRLVYAKDSVFVQQCRHRGLIKRLEIRAQKDTKVL